MADQTPFLSLNQHTKKTKSNVHTIHFIGSFAAMSLQTTDVNRDSVCVTDFGCSALAAQTRVKVDFFRIFS